MAKTTFEFYEKWMGNATGRQPRVVLTDGVMVFNTAAVSAYLDPLAKRAGLDCVGYAKLGYCKATQTIGLFPESEERRQTVCVQQKKGAGAYIGMTGFIRQFGLQAMTYRVLAVKPDDNGLILTFTDERVHKRQKKCAGGKKPDGFMVQDTPKDRVVLSGVGRGGGVASSTSATEQAKLRTHVEVYQCLDCGSDWPNPVVIKCCKCGSYKREAVMTPRPVRRGRPRRASV